MLKIKQRPRIYYTEADKTLMWDRWQKGETVGSIARFFDRYHSSVEGILTKTGGIRPPDRKCSVRALTTSERETISRGLAKQLSMRAIAV